MNLTISSYDELKCLHLSITEAKFHEAPNRKEIQGSPFVAETAHKVFDLLIDAAPTAAEAEKWKNHRVLQANYVIFPIIKKRCEDYFAANELAADDMRKFMADMAAPYTVSDEIEQDLLGRR